MIYSEAQTRLEMMLAFADDPALSATEIAELLKLARVADSNGFAIDAYVGWQAAHAYAIGDVVVPLTRNGFAYEAQDAGTSGATEPVWPVTVGGAVIDNPGVSAITWEALVAPWAGAWELSRAAAEGWRWKAGKCASRFNFSSDVSSFSRDQIFQHCLKMAEHYDGGSNGTMLIGGGVIYDPVIGNLNGGA